MNQLYNRADVTGTFDEVPIENYTELTVELSAFEIVKTADKKIWVKDELEYSIVVTNIDDRDPDSPDDPPQPITNVEVKDIIDPAIATLVAGSVEVDGVTAVYTFDDNTGLLTVALDTIPVGGSKTITFRVEKVQ